MRINNIHDNDGGNDDNDEDSNDDSDDGDDGSKGVLLSSDLCFHFLAAEKIFVLKILSHFTFSPMMMMMRMMMMMKTMGLEAI